VTLDGSAGFWAAPAGSLLVPAEIFAGSHLLRSEIGEMNEAPRCSTLGDDVTVEAPQAALHEWCARRGDARNRPDGASGKVIVATLAERGPLAQSHGLIPENGRWTRTVSSLGLVAFRGDFYSVAPEFAGLAARFAACFRFPRRPGSFHG
jgi:hypothetical protein